MKGFILAAGFGQRMLPITHTLPKPLLPIAGTPLIGYSIALLKQAGITDIIINVHHLAQVLMDALGDGSAYGCTFTYSHESEILGTGGALKRMHDALDDTFVVINSDIVVALDLTALIAQHKQRRALATLVLRAPDESQQKLGRIGIDRRGRVVEILQQKAPAAQGDAGHGTWPMEQSLMFTGVHILEPTFLDYIPHNVHSDVIRYGYMKALANRAPLYGAVTQDFWADAGTPQSYLSTHIAMLDAPGRLTHLAPLLRYRLHPRKDVPQVVCMGDDVHLGEGTTLAPPVLLGDHVKTQGEAALGPYVELGAGVVVGRGAKVSHGVVLPGTKVPSGAQYHEVLVAPDGVLDLGAAAAS